MIHAREYDNATDLIRCSLAIRRKFFPRPSPFRKPVEPLPPPEPVIVVQPESPPPPPLLLAGNFPERVRLADLLNQISDVYGIDIDDLKSVRRSQAIVLARQHFFYLAAIHTKWPMTTISQFVNRDHTTGFWGLYRYCLANGLPMPRGSSYSKRLKRVRHATTPG